MRRSRLTSSALLLAAILVLAIPIAAEAFPAFAGTTETTATISSTYFPVAPGFSDSIPHQIVRTADDRLFLFSGLRAWSPTLVAYWTAKPGLPAGPAEFAGATEVSDTALIRSVDAVYDGARIVHLLVVTNKGVVKDYPFDTRHNSFRSSIILASGEPAVFDNYRGTAGVSGMYDAAGILHLVYWSEGRHVSYASYLYDIASNAQGVVSGPTQIDNLGVASHPALAVSPVDNSVTVAWVSEATTPYQLLARTKSAAGGWDAIQTVSNAPVWAAGGGAGADQGPSLLITQDGVRRLTYIESWDSTDNYGHLHYVRSRGKDWADIAIASYTRNPTLAVNGAGEVFIIGQGSPLDPTCPRVAQICTFQQSGDGVWGPPKVFAAPLSDKASDSSPSVKWSAVDRYRPETIEFLFMEAVVGRESDPVLYYGRLVTMSEAPTSVAPVAPVPIASNRPKTPTATATPTPTPSGSAPGPGQSSSAPPATATPTKTLTVVPTATRTPLPPTTATPRPTSTQTPVPTTTRTPDPTTTRTPDPTSTRTPDPTATRIPDPTTTRTPQPTATPTVDPPPTTTPHPTRPPRRRPHPPEEMHQTQPPRTIPRSRH